MEITNAVGLPDQAAESIGSRSDLAVLEMKCGKGAYVRSVAETLAAQPVAEIMDGAPAWPAWRA